MQQIGRYRILGQLGKGAMGVVYKAEDPAIGRIVAIKTIRLADAATERERHFLRDRLFREARSAGILQHNGIVTIYDVQEEGDYCYVFMEYVDGPTLENLLAAGKLDGARVVDILEQAAAAIDYAHSRGIVHRDLKPANLMVASDGTVKITDFGVAKFTSQQATHTGVVLGTPSYMSPEQISDQKVTGASDQFSLAVIAYQLLTGERPFAADTLPALMFKIVHDPAIPPSRLNPTLGAAVDAVMEKALHKHASERYPDARRFIRALKAALEYRPGWKPLRPGAMQSLDTVAERIELIRPAGARPDSSIPAAADARREEIAPLGQERRAGSGWRWFGLIAAAAAASLAGSWWMGLLKLPARSAVAEPAAVIDGEGGSTRPSAMGPPVKAPDIPPPPPEPVATAAASADQTESPAQIGEASVAKSPTPAAPKGQPGKEALPLTVAARKPKPAQQERAEAEPEAGPVRVITDPPGARVVIDNDPRNACRTPCELALSAGRHTLVVSLDGYRSQSRIFTVPRDDRQIILMERASGTVMIRSIPPGASIFVNGEERKEKTPAVLTLPVGKYRIGVVQEGSRREEQEIEVRDGVVTNLNYSWPN